MNFQNNLKMYREKAGFKTAKDFSDYIGIRYTTYMNYEVKGREPRYETLCLIADKLGVTTDMLLGSTSWEKMRTKELFRICKYAGIDIEMVDSGKDNAYLFNNWEFPFLQEADEDGNFSSSLQNGGILSENDFNIAMEQAIDEYHDLTKPIFNYVIKKCLNLNYIEYLKDKGYQLSKFGQQKNTTRKE